MKKIFFATLVISLSLTIITTTANAQASVEPIFKHSFAAVALPTSGRLNEIKPGAFVTKDAISDKILNNFNKVFINAKDDRWFFENKRIFWVYFDNNGRYTRAAYTKNGTMLHSIAESSENYLTKATRKLIKANYMDYEITSAKEVTLQGNRTIWIVNLESEDRLVMIRVTDFNIDELANYQLAKK